MTTQDLLQALEPQTHAQRVQAMIALGRQHNAESAAMIQELEQGGFYERTLALYSCFGSRDSAHIVRALNDPSRLLRGLAARLVAIACDDAEGLRALEVAPVVVRLRLARALRSRGRMSVVDAYLTERATDAETSRMLLPLASPAVAERLAPQFAEQATTDDWRRLARFHPTIALALLEEQVAAATEQDGRLIARVNLALQRLAAAAPDRALALVTNLRRLAPLEAIAFEALSDARPAAVADLILSEPQLAHRRYLNLSNHVRSLSVEQIVALYRRNQATFGWNSNWFRRLAPNQRAAAFAALEHQLNSRGAVPAQIIAALPAEARAREARKQLALTQRPLVSRLANAAYLPWDEAITTLDPYLHSGDASLRQAALGALIGAVTYHHDRLDDALAQVRQRRTEQDTVRRSMMAALHALPAGAWRADHLSILEEIFRHGLDDVGLSVATMQEMVALCLKLLPEHPEWSGGQVIQMLRERGWFHHLRVVAPASLAAETRLAQALAPLLDVWAAREDELAILEAIDHVFIRPDAFALGANALETLLRRTHNRHYAERALELLRARAPERFGGIVPELLGEDASWITFALVSDHLIRCRQDLISPFLSLQAYIGRWDTGQRVFLPPLSARFVGGTATQQERYASATMAVARDDTQEARVTLDAIKSLALLPAISEERLVTLANDARPVARTTALFALARLDTAAGQPTLLSALGDARGRIAVHALRRYLLAMSTSQALAILRDIALDRVTIAKEVVRLVSELPGEEAYAELLVYARQDLHRDVRIALLHALGSHLDHEQTWAILEEATRAPDREVALAPLRLTTLRSGSLLAQRENLATQRRVLRLIAALSEHPNPQARLDAVRYCAQLGIPDDERVLTPALVRRVEEVVASAKTRAEYDEAGATAAALFGVCTAADEQAVAQTLTALAPHRRLLKQAVTTLAAAPRQRQRRLLSVYRAALETLAKDPMMLELSISLAVARLPAAQLATFLAGVARANAFHADALAHACQLLGSVRNRTDTAEFEALEPRLGASRDERLRRLGLAVLLSRAGSAGGWDDALLERLRVYRADRSVLVASAAQFIIPETDDPGA